MRSTIVGAIAIMLVIVTGCGKDTIVEPEALTDQELEAIVKGNSVTLLEAVELFAIDNGGEYPESVDSDISATGKILIDYLPGGDKLINPFTGIKDQPIDSMPSSPGEIGYYKYQYNDAFYFNVYFIQGFGANSIIIEHDNIEETEAQIIEDCLILQAAVEAFKADDIWDNRYPCGSADCSQTGGILQDYLPDGHLIENRITDFPTEPSVFGYTTNCCAGIICYECIVGEDRVSIGYKISAVGFEPGEYIFQLTVK